MSDNISGKVSDNMCGSFDVIIPVPSAKTALSRRGYNPPDLLAQALSDILCVPANTKYLTKAIDGIPQKGCNAAQRRENVSGAYAVSKRRGGQAAYRRVLLADDVKTTGSTLNECSRVLKEAGAEYVFAAAAASVNFKGNHNDAIQI
ncbi:hypothetical protein FACS1894120_6910 [Clostridia bacterium]|nr:hypothetical protein FACS1894120_6910 [Clostridia bacterium]